MAVNQGVSADGPIARYEQSVIDRIADFNDRVKKQYAQLNA
jgi:hypothetical protein